MVLQKDYITTLTPEKELSINFTDSKKKLCLSLHYYKIVIYLLMVQKIKN